ncbi:MAG TPA: dihydroneopterin aldolase [Miltoncostaeaceae bacterium]|nr:dihydroneopterin aldolase [Miltoncostaeaceae bacterium]
MEGDRVEVRVRGLEVFGRHGVLPEETTLGQRFVIDLDLRLTDCPGVDDDRLEGTVDYAALTDAVAGIVAGPPARLLEHLAGRIAERVLAEPLVAEVAVTVRKPHVAIPHALAETAVRLVRARPGSPAAPEHRR